jgi:hypothetical protein
MSRLVRIPKRANSELSISGLEDVLPGLGGVEGHDAAPAGDNYLERIAKYMPGEVLAFFIFINAVLEQAAKSGGKNATMAGVPVMTVAQGSLLVALILVPLFVWYVREEGDAWLTNAIVSTLAFPFWAYAVGAVAFSDFWDGNLAAILLATFTVVSGLVSPRVKRQKKAADMAASPLPRHERPRLDLIEPSPAA